MLIRDAEVCGRRCDVRLAGGRIAALGALRPCEGETVLDAGGGALLPGLWDHHIHLNAAAAALASVNCAPPHVTDAASLMAALHAASGDDWLRGIGYHPSVTGKVDRAWLDRHGPDRPIRLQHRSGRMWVLNSRACAMLGPDSPADGCLIDGDTWLQARLTQPPPDLVPMGARLVSRGVTGLTEVTPRNEPVDLARYCLAGLPQRLRIMGRRSLDGVAPEVGEVKLHYHDHDLPHPDALAAEIAGAHAAGRGIAAHCVTRGELFVTLSALEAAGPHPGDRIEHAAVAPPEAVDMLRAMDVTVVTQPHFLAERAAAYRREVDADDRPWLYRLAGLARAGVRLAAGSDAPLGSDDPWAAMAAAVDRPFGFGASEALTPEQALALYTGRGDAPGGPPRRVAAGEIADLVLIDRPWRRARAALAEVAVRATWVDGALVYVDNASTNPQASASAAGSRRIVSAR